MIQGMTVPSETNPKPAPAGYKSGKTCPPMSARSRARVLIVDDDRVLRNSVSRLLSTEPDIEVVGEASNGQDAVTRARTLRPDLVVMDIRMPLMDGIEATFLIREEWPDMIVVGFSTFAEKSVKARMMKAGAVELLDKGDAVYSLIPTLHRLWDAHCV